MLFTIINVATVLAVLPGGAPEIQVEQPTGTVLTDGVSEVSFGKGLVGFSTFRGFTIRNLGNVNLTGIAFTITGPNASDFTASANPTSPVIPNGSVAFSVSCTVGGSGARNAVLHIASNDADENPFDIALSVAGATLQQQILGASNDDPGDQFGYAVSMSGDTLVVGADREQSRFGQNDNSANEAGAVYVFVRNGTTWNQQAFIKASNRDAGDHFGYSVALSGNTLVVGAPYEGSTAAGVNGDQSINTSCGAGAAYVFVRNGTTWSQQAYLKASNPQGAPAGVCNPGDYFGWSVGISGDTIIVGAPGEDSNATGVNGDGNNNNAANSGAAYVFVRNDTTWSQQAYVKASNTGVSDQFGISVAASGDTVVVGSANGTTAAGSAYVFVRNGTAWTQQADLRALFGGSFGFSVAVSGNTVVAGSPFGEAAYVFARNGTTWSQQGLLQAPILSNNERFGQSVVVLGDTIAVGAFGFVTLPGAAYVFLRTGSTWDLQAYLQPSSTDPEDSFGWSVAMSGTTVAVGAPFRDTSGGAGAGAVFVFPGLGPQLQEIAVEHPLGHDLIDGSASIDFGSGLLESSSERTFTIRNLGNANLTGLTITIDGVDASDFTVTANPTSPVGPGGSTTFTVMFSPRSPGAKTATLHIASNDTDENPFDIILTGAGISLLDAAQQAYTKASNADAGDNFGFSVAILGDIVVVGAPLEDSSAAGVNGDQTNDNATNSGAAYVFVRNGTTWQQQAYLKAFNPDPDDNFGYSVAISSNAIGLTVVVGAIGESSADGNPNDNSATNAGAAYVFARIGANWSQQAYLKASRPDAEDWFGHSVSISGDTLAVSAMFEDSGATGVDGDPTDNSALDAGAAYVFVRSGVTWTQQAYLKASDSDADDRFGRTVAVSGNTILVGAPREDSNASGVNGSDSNNSRPDSGAAYVFFRRGTRWTQQAYLKASNPGGNDRFGHDVAILGDIAVVSAVFEDSNATGVNGNQNNNTIPDAGAAYLFMRTGTNWAQRAYLKASNPGTNDQFGFSVSLSDDSVVIGAFFEDSGATGINGDQFDNSRAAAGAAYVFVRSGMSWAQQTYLKASNTGAGDRFGTAVSVSADIIVVGAPFEDSNATGINGLQNNNNAPDSGAAYIFTGFCPGPRLAIERASAGTCIIRAIGACTYRLQRAPTVNGPWSNLGTISSADNYHDTLPLPGQTFYRAVQP